MNLFPNSTDKEKEKGTNILDDETIRSLENVGLHPNKAYQDFFESEIKDNENYRIVLYQKPPRNKAKENLIHLEDFVGEEPDITEDIGLIYGRGVYLCYGKHKGQKNPKIRVINLDHEVWDKRKRENDLRLSGGAKPQENNLESTLLLVERIMKMTNNNNESNPFDKTMAPYIKRINDMSIDVVEKGIKERSLLMKEHKAQQYDNSPEDAEYTKESKDPESMWNHPIVESVMEYIKEFGEEFLDSKGLRRKKGRQMINEDDAIIKAKQDPDKIMAIYERACEDPTIGKAKIDELFEEIGMRVNKPTEDE